MFNNEAFVNEMIEFMTSDKYMGEYRKMLEIFGGVLKKSTEEYIEAHEYDENVIAALSEITEDECKGIVRRCLLKAINNF